jgi:hypothetical protein
VGAEIIHAKRQTDMTELTVAFRNFTNAPKNEDAFYVKKKVMKYKGGEKHF